MSMETILEQLRRTQLMKSGSQAAELNGRYRCRVCGYIFDEAEEGKPFSELKECPLCHVGREAFMQVR